MENDDSKFESFWKIVDVPTFTESKMNSEEISCSQHYEQTTTYGHDGRVIVRLPFKESHFTIASNGSDLVPDIRHSARNALRHNLFAMKINSKVMLLQKNNIMKFARND